MRLLHKCRKPRWHHHVQLLGLLRAAQPAILCGFRELLLNHVHCVLDHHVVVLNVVIEKPAFAQVHSKMMITDDEVRQSPH